MTSDFKSYVVFLAIFFAIIWSIIFCILMRTLTKEYYSSLRYNPDIDKYSNFNKLMVGILELIFFTTFIILIYILWNAE